MRLERAIVGGLTGMGALAPPRGSTGTEVLGWCCGQLIGEARLIETDDPFRFIHGMGTVYQLVLFC